MLNEVKRMHMYTKDHGKLVCQIYEMQNQAKNMARKCNNTQNLWPCPGIQCHIYSKDMSNKDHIRQRYESTTPSCLKQQF